MTPSSPHNETVADGWIEWRGGKCPVDAETHVQYRMTDGHEDFGPLGTQEGWPAGNLRWDRHDPFTDIAAYRVVSA